MKIFALLLFLLPSVLSSQKGKDVPLVKVGPIVITQQEFLTRYEMTPGINRKKSDVEGSKAEFLLSMIAEKLLILKARQEGWDNDSLVHTAVNEVEKALVRDELFRKEVQQKIAISEQEINSGMRRALNDMKVYFLYARTKEGAEFLLSQIKQGKPLETFSFTEDSLKEFEGPDSAIARFGDVDVRMEEVIYNLKLNETSKPIQLEDGWYLVKLMGKTVTVVVGDKEKKAVRERVESVIRKRKEIRRMTEYMNSALKNIRTDVNAKLFKSVIQRIWDAAQKKHPVRNDTTMFFVDHSIIDSLRVKLKDSLAMSFVTFPHTVWSLERTMEKIVETNLATVRPTEKRVRADLQQRLRDLIDQEYLAQNGYAQGLHQSAAVRNDLKVWRDSYVSQFVREKIEDSVTVSQDELEELRRVLRNDTLIVNNNAAAQERMLHIKRSDLLDRTAGAVANGTEIIFYEKNFADVQVTTSPSLVYRYLGFGGRMFVVPFVIPQTGWIKYWKNNDIQLP